MSSRKEEERNEKIIRGLMKLPPNRRCINCNSLGPQYICTNFWTFVCTTCSGIHREFTHRVKSVSMSKFTSHEVEALQKGGNQRARETFLKDWDPQRKRLPDNSNADKVREFIKNVYVDRRYAGGKTSDKPPRDVHNLGNQEDETRRASSYHSYSQSPPYDNQYEERRYGKQAPALTRKPGSDRGIYEAKISSFLSPSRLSDHVYEDRFANERSNSGVSDYSVPRRGDPFWTDAQSFNSQIDIGIMSPSSETSRDISIEDVSHHKVNTVSDANAKREAGWVPHPQISASSGSFGSFDSNSMSFKSLNFVTEVDVTSEPEQLVGIHHNKLSAINLFKLPETSTLSVELFQPSPISSVPTLNSQPPSQTSPPSSLDLFSDMPQPQSATSLNEKSQDVVNKETEGWATFDTPLHLEPSQGIENTAPATILSTHGGSLGKFDPLLSLNTSPQWQSFQDSSAHGPSSLMPNPWHEGLHNVGASLSAKSTQSWKAFEDSLGHLPLKSIHQQSSKQFALHNPSIADQHAGLRVSEDFNKDGVQIVALHSGPPIPGISSLVDGSSYASSVLPVMAGAHSHATDRQSTNPFDIPYDSDLEPSNMFLDMSSLQAALPNGQMPTSFIDGVSQPWFCPNPVTPYIPTGPQGALGFMAGQAPSTQIQNVPAQGPVASIGGNPFA